MPTAGASSPLIYDAIHLASTVRASARAMLVYDRRLAEAAEAAGIEILQPGV